jgi:hypothetical protein
MLPNTFGTFRTVVNPNAPDGIDALSIVLTNAPFAGCRNSMGLPCRNPMGLDTIVLSSSPSAPPVAPATFSLSGKVTDSATAAGIPGAAVVVTDGPNAGRSTSTDAAGTYTLAQLLQSGFTVNASHLLYVSQSKGVTLTSDQTLSFDLTRRQPTTPLPSGATVIDFNGVTADGASVTTYSESGFTVTATSGEWIARTTFGNPAPFIQFYASPGTIVTGELRVAAAGSVFGFSSVDVYSSTRPVPYTITGLRNRSTVFTLRDTLPNLLGTFRTVTNPNAAASIDTISIVLTNEAASCSTCRNPMGLDRIVLTR